MLLCVTFGVIMLRVRLAELPSLVSVRERVTYIHTYEYMRSREWGGEEDIWV